jgi:hypothetical protein
MNNLQQSIATSGIARRGKHRAGRALALALCVCLTLDLAPLTSRAASGRLLISGATVIADISTTDGSGTGWSWDHTAATLTLTGSGTLGVTPGDPTILPPNPIAIYTEGALTVGGTVTVNAVCAGFAIVAVAGFDLHGGTVSAETSAYRPS